jgi:predicted RNA binding protein YcfA (HicA-like mRNA interferase family)
MKLPRDISGQVLASKLTLFGYEVTRQNGSHLRLTSNQNGEHHITIPRHNPLKIGTLSGILNDIARHLEINRDEIANKLF